MRRSKIRTSTSFHREGNTYVLTTGGSKQFFRKDPKLFPEKTSCTSVRRAVLCAVPWLGHRQHTRANRGGNMGKLSLLHGHGQLALPPPLAPSLKREAGGGILTWPSDNPPHMESLLSRKISRFGRKKLKPAFQKREKR